MASDTKKAQVLLTMNATQATNSIKDLSRLALLLADDIKEATARMEEFTKTGNSAAAKQEEKNIQSMTTRMQAYTTAVEKSVEQTKSLSDVIADLGNTKLRELRRALGQAKSSLAGLTGSDADLKRADEIRKQMKQIYDEIRLIEGEYVKIAEGMASLSTQSDKWLSKALKQQKELVADLQKTDATYNTQLDTLKKLEAEEDRRNGKMSVSQAMGVARNDTSTASELRRAKAALIEGRDNTELTDTGKINAYNRALNTIETRLKSVGGTAKMTTAEMKKIWSNPRSASQNDINKVVEELNRRLKDIPVGSKNFERLSRKIKELESFAKGANQQLVKVNDVIARSKQGKANINELKQAYKQLEEELNKLNTGSKEFISRQKDLKGLKAKIDSATGAVKSHSSAWQTAIQNLTMYVGAFAMFNKAKEMITGVIKKNYEMSDSLANIRKVSGLAYSDIEKMTRSLAKIDTRTTIQELNQIAYAGAKLGIGDMGAGALEGFTRAANKVNVALKEDLGDEALTALSKITQVMGLIPRMGVEQSMLKTGSAIFKLASTSTATSGKIIDFSNRLLAMGKQGALSTADILALGAAVDSMALEPEVASTAFNKMIAEIRKGTTSLESDLGLAKNALKSLVEQGKGMEAIQLIFQKMNESKNVFALDGLFKDMGSEGGARMIKTMVTMADNVEILNKAVRTANQAFDEGSAVTAEYNIQQNTAQGLLERANNLWNKAFVNPEGIDNVKELAKQWYDMSKFLTENEYAMTSLKVTLDIIFVSVKTLIAILPALLAGLMFKGISSIIIGIGTALLGAGDACVIATLKAKGLTAAWRELNLTMKANWISVIIGLLVEGGVVMYELYKKTHQANGEIVTMNSLTKQLKSGLASAEVELRLYHDAVVKAADGTKQKTNALKEWNEKYGKIKGALLDEKSTVDQVAQAYRNAAAAIKAKTLLEMKAKMTEKVVGTRIGWELDKLNKYGEYETPGRSRSWLKAYEEDNRGKSFEEVKQDLARQLNVNDPDKVLNVFNSGRSELVDTEDKQVRRGSGANMTATNISGYKHTNEQRQYLAALHYIAQARSTQVHGNMVDNVFLPYQKMMEDALTIEEEKPTPVANKPADTPVPRSNVTNTPPSTSNTVVENPAKEARADIGQMLTQLKAYYDVQTAALTETLAQTDATEQEQADVLDAFAERRRKTFAELEKVFVMGSDDWEKFRSDFEGRLSEDKRTAEGDPITDNLFNELLAYNVAQIREDVYADTVKTTNSVKYKKLYETKKYTRNGKEHEKRVATGVDAQESTNVKTVSNEEAAQSVMAGLFAKAAGEDVKSAQANLKRKNAIQKELLERDYTGMVDKSTVNGLELLGFVQIDPTSDEVDKYRQSVADVLKSVRDNVVELLSLDADAPDFNEKLFAALFGEDYNESMMDTPFKSLLVAEAEDVNLFYQKLIQYFYEYTDAQKKEVEKRKKDNEFLWTRTDYYKQYKQQEPGMEQKSSVLGSSRTLGQKMGFQSIEATDPELEMMKARMEFAEEYYNFLEKHNATEQELAEARKNIMQAQSDYAKRATEDMFEQYNAMLKLMEPVQTFGESLGEAFVTMRKDSKEGKKAVVSAVKSMLKSMATQTLQLISQQQIERAQTAAHYAEMLAMQTAFGTAKVTTEETTGNTLNTTRTTQQTTEEQKEVVHQSKMAALRSAGIFGWCVSTLGPIAGPIAYSAMMAVLMGLLTFAIGLIGGGSDTSASAASGPNTKLVSGMLTYDQGNVSDLKPFFDKEGNMYWAAEDDSKHTGVSLLTQPTATTINGRPSLVAENGPEIVIGRETTRAMMQNDPGLLRTLYNYDKNHSGRRAYDTGNVSDLEPTVGADGQTVWAERAAASNEALIEAVNTLLDRLKQPITAKVDMYGRGNLYDSMSKASQFMKNK